MTVPDPWSALILVACIYRLWRLLAEDTILDQYRYQLVGLPTNWQEGDEIPPAYRSGLAQFINCSWCFGFWIGLAVWGVWELVPYWTEVISIPFALSAGVGVIRARLDPPD